jgi:hypothetical protein
MPDNMAKATTKNIKCDERLGFVSTTAAALADETALDGDRATGAAGGGVSTFAHLGPGAFGCKRAFNCSMVAIFFS